MVYIRSWDKGYFVPASHLTGFTNLNLNEKIEVRRLDYLNG